MVEKRDLYKILVLAIVCTFLFTGCGVGRVTKENFERKVKSWVGKDASVLELTYGLPMDIKRNYKNNVLYKYLRNYYSHDFYCAIYFEIDKDTYKIVKVDWKGDSCKSK